MRTDDLIKALAADATPRGPSLRHGLLMALVVALVVGAVVMQSTIGMRANALVSFVTSWRFVFKFVVTFAVFSTALIVSLRLARPGTRVSLWLLAVPVLLLAGAVGMEMVLMPESTWLSRLIGTNWRFCLTFGPLISLGPLAALLAALKRGAPESPTRAGLVAGLAAGGIGTFFYAAHCPDDSPLFVAAWYSIVIVMMGALGAVLGRRLLRW